MPGMPRCQGYPHGGRTGGIIVPIMMIVMMDVVTRPWHYGTGGYTGPATAASTPTLISVVVATPSWPHPHTTARPRAPIIQIHSSDCRDLCRGSSDHSLSWFLVTLSRYIEHCVKNVSLCGCAPHSITSCPISPVYDIECGPLDK